ncbi:lectin-like domain-containing protein [Lactiplantibacillus pentosus]
MRKLTSWGLLVGLLVVILGLWWSTVAATADELDSLPKSALNLDGLFEVGKFEQNAASKLAVDQGDGHTANVFELNNDNNQVGAIWSTPVNRFNLNVDNKITMLVNFGDRGAGEGLALVLQNDPRKTAAISRFGTKRVIGENLGVYGTDTYSRKTASSTIAKTAIQKS